MILNSKSTAARVTESVYNHGTLFGYKPTNFEFRTMQVYYILEDKNGLLKIFKPKIHVKVGYKYFKF